MPLLNACFHIIGEVGWLDLCTLGGLGSMDCETLGKTGPNSSVYKFNQLHVEFVC